MASLRYLIPIVQEPISNKVVLLHPIPLKAQEQINQKALEKLQKKEIKAQEKLQKKEIKAQEKEIKAQEKEIKSQKKELKSQQKKLKALKKTNTISKINKKFTHILLHNTENDRPGTPETHLIKSRNMSRSIRAIQQPRKAKGTFYMVNTLYDLLFMEETSTTPIEYITNIYSTNSTYFIINSNKQIFYNYIKTKVSIQIELQLQGNITTNIYFKIRLINQDGSEIYSKKLKPIFICEDTEYICINNNDVHKFNIRINEVQRNCILQIKECNTNAKWTNLCNNLTVRTKIPNY